MKQNKAKRKPQEHRFYMIRARQIKNIFIEQCKQTHQINNKKYNSSIIFEIGWRSSEQTFSVTKQGNCIQSQKQIFKQYHMFPFQKQQVMTIRIKPFKKLQSAQNIDNKNDQYWHGYALLPLTPFIKSPHIKHQIEVDMIQLKDRTKAFRKDKFATLIIQLQFLCNFKATLIISPITAHLSRNVADIGQMSQKLQFKMGNKIFQTGWIEQGGIKPHFKNQKLSSDTTYVFLLDNVQDKLQIKMTDLNDFIKIFQSQTNKKTVGQAIIDLQYQCLYKNNIFKYQLFQQFKYYVQKLQNQKKQQEQKKKKKQQMLKRKQKKRINQISLQKGQNLNKQMQIKQNFNDQQILNQSVSKSINNALNSILSLLLTQKTNSSQIKQQTFSEYVTSLLQFLKVKYPQRKQQNIKSKIKSILFQKLNLFWQFIENQIMIKNQIKLTFQQNQKSKDKQIGFLTINYVLIKEFQYQTDDSKQYQIDNQQGI